MKKEKLFKIIEQIGNVLGSLYLILGSLGACMVSALLYNYTSDVLWYRLGFIFGIVFCICITFILVGSVAYAVYNHKKSDK